MNLDDRDNVVDGPLPFPWGVMTLFVGIPMGGAVVAMSMAFANASDWTGRAAQGDWWGGYLAAGAGLASAFLLFYAVWLQRQELRHQREELRLTRAEMSLARLVYEKQADLMQRQLGLMQESTARDIIASLLTHRANLYANITAAGPGRMAAKRELKALDDYLVHISGEIGVDEDEHEHLLRLLQAGQYKD